LAAFAAVPAPGDAQIWYVGHCGYAVRTARHLLVFDYQERRDGPQPRTAPPVKRLDAGWVTPGEIERDRVRVFVSHEHSDHWDPVVLGWRTGVPDIQYFFGWRATDDPTHHLVVAPRGSYSRDGLEVLTVNSHHSGVPEVAWLVKVDGLTIYHNGDYQGDHRADYDYLHARGVRGVDLAFVMGVSREDLAYTIQNRALFERFTPKAVFPMHGTAGSPMYLEFDAAMRQRMPGLRVLVPERLGDRFDYHAGVVARSTR